MGHFLWHTLYFFVFILPYFCLYLSITFADFGLHGPFHVTNNALLLSKNYIQLDIWWPTFPSRKCNPVLFGHPAYFPNWRGSRSDFNQFNSSMSGRSLFHSKFIKNPLNKEICRPTWWSNFHRTNFVNTVF